MHKRFTDDIYVCVEVLSVNINSLFSSLRFVIFSQKYLCVQYYTSPISGLTFTMKSEVLQYLFSGMDERFLESKNCAADNQLIVSDSIYIYIYEYAIHDFGCL